MAGKPRPRPTGELPVGTRLGRYELLRPLGAGGMAEVHLARITGIEGFQKFVVLKRILPHLANDEEFVRMFLAEAKLAAMLDHPNVVQVFDLGDDGGDFFFTMEYVHGENVQNIMRAAQRGRGLPIEFAVAVVIGAAAGLHYAHECAGFDGKPLGIVHRDVSPTNILVTYDGGVKVADFGIAKVVSRTDVTRAGTRKGKVPYMSPEQCQSARVDRRSDVFSLGILLYECSTLTRLFRGDNEFAIMNQVVHGDLTPPSRRRDNYPIELERIVMRALQRDRDRRYPTAAALLRDLETFARQHQMAVSATSLSEGLKRLFHAKPYPWEDLTSLEFAAAYPTSAVTIAEKTPRSDPQLPSEQTGSTVSGMVSSSYDVGSGPSGSSAPSVRSVPSASHSSAPSPSHSSVTHTTSVARMAGLAAAWVGIVGSLTAAAVLGIFFVMSNGPDETEDADAEAIEADAPEPEAEAEPVAEPEPEPEPAPAQPAQAGAPDPVEESDEEIVVVDESDESDEPSKPETKRGAKKDGADKPKSRPPKGSEPKGTRPKPRPKPKPKDEPKPKPEPDLDELFPD